jgi:hypothetical protein
MSDRLKRATISASLVAALAGIGVAISPLSPARVILLSFSLLVAIVAASYVLDD